MSRLPVKNIRFFLLRQTRLENCPEASIKMSSRPADEHVRIDISETLMLAFYSEDRAVNFSERSP